MISQEELEKAKRDALEEHALHMELLLWESHWRICLIEIIVQILSERANYLGETGMDLV